MLSPEMLQKLRASSPWRPGFSLETCPVLSLVISVARARMKYYYILNGRHWCQDPQILHPHI